MVFAHRLECDRTDEESSILVPSALLKLPLLLITALLKHGVAAAATSSSSSAGYGPSASEFSSSSSFSHLYPASALYYGVADATATTTTSGGGGGGFGGRRGSTRWEPSLPTIDEEPQPPRYHRRHRGRPRCFVDDGDGALPTRLVDVHGNPIVGIPRAQVSYDDEEPPSPTAIVTLALWMPAILWGVSSLWFVVEQTALAASPSSGSCRVGAG